MIPAEWLIAAFFVGAVFAQVVRWTLEPRSTIGELMRTAQHREPPPMPKVKPSRQEVQVLPANATGLILTYPAFLIAEQRKQVQEMAAQGLSKGVLILEGGIQLSAVFVRQGEDYLGDAVPIPMPKPGTMC